MGKSAFARVGFALALLALLAGRSRAAEDADLSKKALKLNEITGTAPLQGQLAAMLDDEAGTTKLLKAAADMVKDKAQPFNRNATLVLALAADNFKLTAISAKFYRLNAKQEAQLQSESGVAQAYGGLIQMYYDHKKYAESEKACQEFLALEGDEDGAIERLRPMVQRRRVLAVAKRGALDKAVDMADKLIEEHPGNWLMVALKGQIYREADKYQDAIKAYREVIAQIKKDRRLKKEERQEVMDEYRYLLSGLYVDVNEVDKATAELKTLLEHDPNNSTYNNDLGFLWADNGKNLAEAEKMIRKALAEDRKLRKKAKGGIKPSEDRDNAAYLDSLGWVLFKQGKLKEAKVALRAAVKEKDGQSTEIYDHLGDVLLALGEKEEAAAAWKKAIEVASPDSKRDQKRKAEVAKKLKARERADAKP
jgi:tetratricopeptide (TPR) repeat protein